MDLKEFKSQTLRKKINIDIKKFGKIYCFIDFGNVNHWFDKDKYLENKKQLDENEKFFIDIEKLF